MRGWPLRRGATRVQTDVGRLLLHADDRVMTPWIREHGYWESDEGAWLRGAIAPGATVLDVGANVGYFSVLCARAAGPSGRVFAVEPESANLRLLRANVRRNHCRNVKVIAAAAWDGPGELALRRNAANRGDHQVRAEPRAGDALVRCLALDEVLGGQRVDVIKVDTQGADHRVIAGLEQTLAANPQARVLVEFWTDVMVDLGISAADVLAGYRRLGPIALLGAGGSETPADDEQVLASVAGAPDHWINLILR